MGEGLTLGESLPRLPTRVCRTLAPDHCRQSNATFSHGRSPCPAWPGVIALVPVVRTRAQEFSLWSFDPVLPRDPEGTFTPPARPNRIRVFGIQPAFLSDPVGLDDEDARDPDQPAQYRQRAGMASARHGQ